MIKSKLTNEQKKNSINMLLQSLVALLDKHDAALLDLNKSELQTLTTTFSTMSIGC